MKPANCLLCGKPSLDEISPAMGNWIQFADYQASDEFSIGHPDRKKIAKPASRDPIMSPS